MFILTLIFYPILYYTTSWLLRRLVCVSTVKRIRKESFISLSRNYFVTLNIAKEKWLQQHVRKEGYLLRCFIRTSLLNFVGFIKCYYKKEHHVDATEPIYVTVSWCDTILKEFMVSVLTAFVLKKWEVSLFYVRIIDLFDIYHFPLSNFQSFKWGQLMMVTRWTILILQF